MCFSLSWHFLAAAARSNILMKPKQNVKGDTDLEDFDFDDYDEDEGDGLSDEEQEDEEA